MPRPRKSEQNRAVETTVEARHLDMVDRKILNSMGLGHPRRDSVGHDRLIAIKRGLITPQELAAKRREVIGRLIEDNLGADAGTRIRVLFPVNYFFNTSDADQMLSDVSAVADWGRDQEDRLMKEAPPSVRASIEFNREMAAMRHGEEESSDGDA